MGANINSSAPGAFERTVLKVIQGVTQVIPAKSSLVVEGSSMTQPQVLQKLQGLVSEYEAIRDARAKLQDAITQAKSSHGDDREFLMQVHVAIVSVLGRKSSQLQQFGYTPMKSRVKSASKNVEAAAKRTVTRRMRNTMGKKKKETVKASGSPVVSISNGVVSITPSAADVPATAAAQPQSASTESTTPSGASTSSSGGPSGSSSSNNGGK